MEAERLTYAQWISNFTEKGFRRKLTEEEQAALDLTYRQNLQTALKVVWKHARVDDAGAWDVVHGAFTRMLRNITEDTKPLPATADAVRKCFLTYVRNVARQVGARSGTARVEPKPAADAAADTATIAAAEPEATAAASCSGPVSNRKVPERLITKDLDQLADPSMRPKRAGDYNAEPGQQAEVDDSPVEMRQNELYGVVDLSADDVDALWDLQWIMECACEQLPPGQKAVIELYLQGKERNEITDELHIADSTYDTHMTRAKEKMRFTLLACRPWLVLNAPWYPEGCHFSTWSLEFTRLEEERLARLHAPPDRSAA